MTQNTLTNKESSTPFSLSQSAISTEIEREGRAQKRLRTYYYSLPSTHSTDEYEPKVITSQGNDKGKEEISPISPQPRAWESEPFPLSYSSTKVRKGRKKEREVDDSVGLTPVLPLTHRSTHSLKLPSTIDLQNRLLPPLLTKDLTSHHYSLTFTLSFDHDCQEDTVYLAMCYPFSYSLLQHHLRLIDLKMETEKEREYEREKTMTETEKENNQNGKTGPSILHPRMRKIRHGRILRRSILCHTLAGNAVPLLTITNFESSSISMSRRRYVVVSARVHPGETNASWMAKGVIDFLLSDCDEAR